MRDKQIKFPTNRTGDAWAGDKDFEMGRYREQRTSFAFAGGRRE